MMSPTSMLLLLEVEPDGQPTTAPSGLHRGWHDAPMASKPTYVANVTLFDGRTVKSKRGVLFGEEGIAWVGAHARTPREARDARVVDGAGRTLLPGLIDVHVHLQFDGAADFEAESKGLTTPGHAAIKAVVNARRNLEAGITTVRDLGGMGGASIDVARAVTAGLIPGPRILAVGRALTVTGGHGHNIALSREVDGADGVRAAVREEIRAGASAIKLIATGGVLTPGIPVSFSAFTADELEAGVREAHERGLPVAAHAIGAEGIRAAVLAGVDSIEHCNQLTTATAREMVQRGTYRSPTISAIRGIVEHADRVPAYAVEKAEQIEADSRRSHATAIRAGVRHACGTDAGTPFNPHGGAGREVAFMTEWGMRAIDALRAATVNGAALLGLDDVGSVDEGKRADLVLVDGDPSEDPTALLGRKRVWQAGRPV
jgi:imidazolonepropionase-like amidohydrolase